MYEVRKAARTYRIYDRVNKRYVANTKDERAANDLAQDLLHSCAFEGAIPNFFLQDKRFGINLDKKNVSD